jgi:peptidoglycan/xylan/chitin deacetylase (PgdA/CDA1 family)
MSPSAATRPLPWHSPRKALNETMRKFLRRVALTTLKNAGVFSFVKNSAWRRQRLLILCYHGVSMEDENQWRPLLYMSPQCLQRRLDLLQKENYAVLALSDGLERLYRRDLPPRSVAITFDDGTYDFYRQAYPLLKQHGFPATVYLTSYYSEFQRPVFNLICSYMMWKARDRGTVNLSEFGMAHSLGSAEACQDAASRLVQWADSQNLTGEQKDQVAARLARCLQIDYDELRAKRILQVMNQQEVRQLAEAGVDFQLHTHRHRTPLNEDLFRRELRDNRAWISSATGQVGNHFCYPSGVYRLEFLPWLSAEQVVSATTCEPGLASPRHNPLLLPRVVDTTGSTDLDFEGWATGVGHFLPSWKRRRLAHQSD